MTLGIALTVNESSHPSCGRAGVQPRFKFHNVSTNSTQGNICSNAI